MKKKVATIAIDWDGVIYSYTSGFLGITKLPDPPVEGAIWFLESCINYGFKTVIFSTRCRSEAAIKAMKKWLTKHGLSEYMLKKISFSKEKPIAKVYIDDRAWNFAGKFPTVVELDNFLPWHGGKSSSEK